jgi:hypothetical protein
MTLVADSSFESALAFSTDYDGFTMTNWSGITTESATDFSTTRVASTGGHGSYAIRGRVPQSSTGDGTGALTINGPSGMAARSLYQAMRLRFDAADGSYRFHANGEKMFYPILTEHPTWSTSSLINIGGDRSLIGIEKSGEVSASISSAGVIPASGWFTIEIYVRMNTPETNDGTWHVWIDDVQVVNQNDSRFFDGGTQVYFDYARYDDTRGGGSDSEGVGTGGQWRDLDRLAVYKGS